MMYRIIAKNAGIHYSEEPHFFGLDTDTETEGDQCITELRNKFMNIPEKKTGDGKWVFYPDYA